MFNVEKEEEDNYIIHLDTRNVSFLKMYALLKKLNIKNNKFFLRLYDTDLKNIDPHSNKLTDLQKTKILKECVKNPWYYIREVIRIPVTGGMKKFELHLGNLAELFCMFTNTNFYLMLPRQNYKTISMVVGLVYIFYVLAENYTMTFTNKSDPDAKENLKRFRDIARCQPKWLQQENKEDNDNIKYFYLKNRNNTIKTISPGRDPVAADLAGRGLTTPIIWYDEFDFIKYIETMYMAAGPASSQAAIEAESFGVPHFIGITTTPNNIDTEGGLFGNSVELGACAFTESMYDLNPEELKNYIKHNSDNDFVFISYNYKQLGRDKQWFKEQCRVLLNNKMKIKREVLLERTKSSDDSIFSEEEIESLEAGIVEKKGELFLMDKAYILEMLEILDPSQTVFIGVDVAAGLSRDFCSLVFTNPNTLEPLAVFKNNKMDSELFFNLICEILEIFPLAVLFIERNSLGISLITRLLHSKFKKNIYYSLKETNRDKGIVKPDDFDINSDTKIFGVNTTKESRDVMINDILFPLVSSNPHIFRSKIIVDEIKRLIRNKQGKIEHGPGFHDDNLFAYLIVRYAFYSSIKTVNKFLKNDDDKKEKLSKLNMINYFNRTNIIDKNNLSSQIINREAGNEISRISSGNNIISMITKLNKGQNV